jgi:hypothetical protein
MTNNEMKAGRFLRWHKARHTIRVIEEHIAKKGGMIQISTYTKHTRITKKNYYPELFKATKTGLYMRRGKTAWDCIDGCKITGWIV